ncbi:hypothetical protein D0T49_00805 [Paludibacter sp. 221]|uniref:zinc-binding metallopeptidase n=1 Tax=Paludibacter sp. 221 TaxID=2302939 RepID=UPI0013D61084|nr:putative zinc-binding metallopeptidase [Paludibacter sp. 221]NDV45593.1 hypothetical protein [Paludibacter sp. 221]
MKKAFSYFISIILFTSLIGCSEEKLGPSIFDTNPPERNEFDKWLLNTYVKEYNIDFKYRLDDGEADLTYNLIPADMEKSKDLAKIIKYLWLEAYDELFDATGVNKDFMRTYAPKVIQLVGSAAINSSSGTEVLGTAEGGIKVILYKVNAIDPTDIEMLNEYYFETMHHEFSHILHQNEEIPVEFNLISAADYSSTGWQNRTTEQAWKLGFVTPYASREPQEDFVEIIAMYLVNSDEYWQNMLDKAGEEGAKKIEKKFDIVEEWLNITWDIDIHKLRNIISRRAQNIESILND